MKRGELNPEEIATEVFLMPAAGQAEKSGSFTNTQRLVQWHNQAVEPPGDARSETWFTYHLGRLLKEKAARQPTPTKCSDERVDVGIADPWRCRGTGCRSSSRGDQWFSLGVEVSS